MIIVRCNVIRQRNSKGIVLSLNHLCTQGLSRVYAWPWHKTLVIFIIYLCYIFSFDLYYHGYVNIVFFQYTLLVLRFSAYFGIYLGTPELPFGAVHGNSQYAINSPCYKEVSMQIKEAEKQKNPQTYQTDGRNFRNSQINNLVDS